MTNPTLEGISTPINFRFGDHRINKRANFMVDKMINSCGKTIPQAFCTSGDLKGVYRFYDNNLVTPKKILDPHQIETIKRCQNEDVIIAIQDSSDIDYSYIEGLEGYNPLHDNFEKGLRIHPTFIINKKGTPLGIINTYNYTRMEKDELTKKHRNSLNIEDKESFRWLHGYREACKLACQAPGVKVISVADREGDIYECFAEAQQVEGENKAEILVRAKHNRSLACGSDDTNNKLEKKLTRSAVSFEGKVLINQYRENERTANVVVRATKVTINAPSTCKKKYLKPIELNAVAVTEVDPPKDEPPLYWILLTTLPINSVKQIQSIISYYAKRWSIEIFFKVLKSGCKIDSPRFQEPKRIENFIALSMLVAWKVMLVTYLPREYPDEPCTLVFTELEWKLAYTGAYKIPRPLPKTIPTLKEVSICVAMLGGYQKRKSPPGIQTIWRGMVKLIDMSYGVELMERIRGV